MTYMSNLKTRDGYMEIGNIPAVIAAVTALLVAFGGGIKWMLSRQDTHDLREREWQSEERKKLEHQFNERITHLTERLENQTDEIGRLRAEMAAYMRQVGILEGMLGAHGVDIPPFRG